MASPTRTTEGIYRPTGLPPEIDPYDVEQRAQLESKIAAKSTGEQNLMTRRRIMLVETHQ